MIEVDIKHSDILIEQYVALRNIYADELLTHQATLDETKKWLITAHVEMKGLAENNTLLGAVVLYYDRNNEIAFFVKDKNRKIGSKLLDIIEKTAQQKNIMYLSAWVRDSNSISQRVFQKKNYEYKGLGTRIFKGSEVPGLQYIKYLSKKI